MIDGIKLFAEITIREYSALKTKYEFKLEVNATTGEIINNKEVFIYRGMNLTLIAKRYCCLKGSIHKAFYNGVNYTDFTFTELKYAIKIIEKDLNIPANRLKIQRIEFGVNVRDPPLSYERIYKNIINYKGDSSNHMKNNKSKIGIEFLKQRYTLKIYNKSKQELLPDNILRIELKVIKMEHIRITGIGYLSNLNNLNAIMALGKVLSKSFKDLLMDNDKINFNDLSAPEKEVYLNGRNPKFWEYLKYTKQYCAYTSQKKKFIAIVNKYANENLANELQIIVVQQWQKLLNL